MVVANVEVGGKINEYICKRCDDNSPINDWPRNFDFHGMIDGDITLAVIDPKTNHVVHRDEIEPGDLVIEYETKGHSGHGDPRDGYVTYHVKNIIGEIEG